MEPFCRMPASRPPLSELTTRRFRADPPATLSAAMSDPRFTHDCIIAGGGFAGLACATALARRGLRVRVLERKRDPGLKLRTTGIIVRDAVDQIALLDQMPPALTRRIPAVRLYAPNLTSTRLEAPGYYFLATDTPGLMRWLASQAQNAGAEVVLSSPFTSADAIPGGWNLGALGSCRFLIGADGANSRVAATLGLGRNRKLLHGIEHEYRIGPATPTLDEFDALHCFVDRRIAPGYIAWILGGVNDLQVGLAGRGAHHAANLKEAMRRFLDKISALIPLQAETPDSVRAGPIPCGGLVRPLATQRSLLVGDAAGMVSPVTAGGIHTALKYGLASGHAIADFLEGRANDPAQTLARRYPRFRAKRLLRWAFDHFQWDWTFNLLLSAAPMRRFASQLYFHR